MKYDEMVANAIEMIKANDDLLVELVNELDGWNGFADGFRLWQMSDIDEFYYGCSASKLLEDMTGGFNKYDDYFYFTIYGLESTSEEPCEFYKGYTTPAGIFDNVKEYFYRLNISDNDFNELVEQIINYDED